MFQEHVGQSVRKFVVVIFGLCFALLSQVVVAQSDGSVEIRTVSQNVEIGGVVPVTVVAKGFDSDPISSVIISVQSNPEGYRDAFGIEFSAPAAVFSLGSRIRLGVNSPGVITAKFVQQSGATFERTARTGNVLKRVNFGNPSTLIVSFPGSVKFPTDDLGQPMKLVGASRDHAGLGSVRGILSHPMLPGYQGSDGFYIRSVKMIVNEKLFANVSLSPVVSNDPFVQLDADIPTDEKLVRMEWVDSFMNVFSR